MGEHRTQHKTHCLGLLDLSGLELGRQVAQVELVCQHGGDGKEQGAGSTLGPHSRLTTVLEWRLALVFWSPAGADIVWCC